MINKSVGVVVREPKLGSQAEPEAFRAHLRPDSIEPENGPHLAEVKECEELALAIARSDAVK